MSSLRLLRVVAIAAAGVGLAATPAVAAAGANAPHALWYRLELRVTGMWEYAEDTNDPVAANPPRDSGGNPLYPTLISFSSHDTIDSEWTVKSNAAFILYRHGLHLAFSAAATGDVERVNRTIRRSTTDRIDDPRDGGTRTCTNVTTESLPAPLPLLSSVRQGPDRRGDTLGYYTQVPAGRVSSSSEDNCAAVRPPETITCEGVGCAGFYVGGGETGESNTVRDDSRPRKLAVKLSSLAQFGQSFTITRTISKLKGEHYTPAWYGEPNSTGTTIRRSRVTYELIFTACPQNGRGVKHC